MWQLCREEEVGFVELYESSVAKEKMKTLLERWPASAYVFFACVRDV